MKQAIDEYVQRQICKAFGVPYIRREPQVRREPIYFDDEFDVCMYDPGRPAHYQLRAWRIRRNGGTFTERDWQRLLARDKCCLRCGTTENLSMDHVIPVAKGGRHSFSNAQVLCRPCNSWKHTKIIDFRAKV